MSLDPPPDLPGAHGITSGIGVLAGHLPGKPTSRSRHALRHGRRASSSLKIAGPKAGTWYDHDAQETQGTMVERYPTEQRAVPAAVVAALAAEHRRKIDGGAR